MLTAALRRARSQARAHGSDAGLTLIELMIAMGLLSIIGTMSIFFFVGMNTASSTTVDANVATAQARDALQSWTTLLTLADSPTTAGSGSGRFTEITPTSATFYSNADANRASSGAARTAPEKVTLSLESGALIERTYDPSTGALQAQRRLADSVSRTGGAWLFTPSCASTATSGSTTVGSCSSTAAGSSALATVVRVDIAFTLTLSTGGTENFTSSAAISGSTS